MNVATIVFLLAVVVDMGIDGGETGIWTVAAIPVIALVLALGWRAAARRRMAEPQP